MTVRHLVLLLLPFLAAPAALGERTFVATPAMAEETQLIVRLLENVHFNGKELDQDDLKQLVPDYLEDLDSQRLFLLAGDVKAMQARFESRLFKDLHYRGNLDAAFEPFGLFLERVRARVAWIEQRLRGEWDFTTRETFLVDRSKAEWPRTPEEADALWERRLKFELLVDLLNDKPLDTARENVAKRYGRLRKNFEELDAEEVQEIYLSALTRMYDPHTTFMSPSQLEEFSTQMRLSLVGIGAQLMSDDGVCVVRELIPGGPAALSQALRPNDKIVAVAQGDGEFVDVMGMKLRKVVELIRGDKGTTVRLLVIPSDATDSATRKEVALVRDVVKLNASRAAAAIHEVTAPDGAAVKVGVIELPSFYGLEDAENSGGERISATRDVERLIRKLTADGVQGIVLDLRQNGGGLLSEAVELTGLFIPSGPVVQVKNSNGRVEVRPDADESVTYSGPLAVLTSRYSASASEIVAGALQNYGRAIVIGDSSTHGKGTVQAVLEMAGFLPRWRAIQQPRMGAARLTVQKFYLPNGDSTQNRGVVPDIVLPSIEEFLPIGESDLPNALAWDTVPPVAFERTPLDPRLLDALRERSRQRQDLTEEFAYLRRNINWLRERQAIKEVSLNLEERRAQKAADDAFRAELKAQRAELARLNFPKTDVRLEGVEPPPPPPAPQPGAADSPEAEVADNTEVDIHLREGLRVLADAIELWQNPQFWRNDGHPLAATAPKPGDPVR